MKTLKKTDTYISLDILLIVFIPFLLLTEIAWFYKILFLIFIIFLYIIYLEEVEINSRYVIKKSLFISAFNSNKVCWNNVRKINIRFKGGGIKQNDHFILLTKTNRKHQFNYSFSKDELKEIEIFTNKNRIEFEVVNSPYEEYYNYRKIPNYEKYIKKEND